MTEPRHTTPDPISAAVNEVLVTFREALSEVRFPEVDRGALESLADDVRARAADAALAKVTLAGALEALEDAQGRLARRAELALAYARVYAESAADISLGERLASIPLGRSPKIERRAPTPTAPRRTRKQRGTLIEGAGDVVPQLALNDSAMDESALDEVAAE